MTHVHQDVEHFLIYPTDHVIGVVDDVAQAQATLAELIEAGFPAEEVRLFHGADVAQ